MHRCVRRPLVTPPIFWLASPAGRSARWALEIGDRLPGDQGTYPDDDLKAVMGPDGRWLYTRKDGSPL
jgi:hypothetical protein